MEILDGLPAQALTKADPAPDTLFYAAPRFVTHIDDAAIGAVTRLYRELLPAGGNILDLMSSWVSHLPDEVMFGRVVGIGMNAEELAANPRLSEFWVQDLNRDPRLDFPATSFDAACLCVSVQYLQQPVAVFSEVRRVLRSAGPMVVTFSNRCFPTKAVAIWQALSAADQQRLVALYLTRAGFTGVTTRALVPPAGDPIYAVVGYAPAPG